MKQKSRRTPLWMLFFTFAKVGVMMFGGGLAMLPILRRCVVEERGWITDQEMTDCYAIGQCTPGIIAVNTATFVGFKQRGVIGGILATLGIVFPSLVIITVIAAFLRNFAELPLVQNAFAGIRACVCVLIINTIIKLWKSTIVSPVAAVIFGAVFVLSTFTSVSAVILVLAAGAVGLAVTFIRKKRGAK